MNRLAIILVLFLSTIAALSMSVIVVEVLCCIVYLLCFFSWRKKDGFSIYLIFLITMFVFCVSMVWGDLLGVSSIYYFEKFGELYRFNEDVILKTLKSVIFFLAGIVLGWELFKHSKSFNNSDYGKISEYSFPSSVKRPMLLLFGVLFLPAFAKAIILVASAVMFGYVESVHLGAVLDVNPIVSYTTSIFEIYGILCIYICRSKKEFLIVSSLYAIPIVMTIFTGQRGPGILIMLLFLWMYNTFFEKINMKYWFMAGIGVSLLAQFIAFSRGDNVDLEQNAIVRLLSFITNQGESYHTVSMTILYEDSFSNKIPFFLGYIPDMFVSADSYTIDVIIEKNYLAYHLAYNAFNNAFMVGHTIGTSMIAEFYELVKGNYVLILPCSALTMYLAAFLSKHLYDNPVFFAIGFKYLMSFLYSPRDSVGKIFTRGFLYLLIFMILVTIYYKLRSRKQMKIISKNV